MTYYEYEEEEKALELARKKQQEQNKIILFFLILGAGATYLFLVYLPEQKQIKELEEKIQTDIDKLNTVQPAEYQTLLTKLQGYLTDLANGTEWQKNVFENKKEILKKAIEWLQVKQIESIQQASVEAQRNLAEIQRKKEEAAKKKKLHWQRKSYNWADELMSGVVRTSYEKGWTELKRIFGGEEPDTCTFGAQYTIHFPPYCWDKLSNEQKYIDGKPKPGITLLDTNENLIFTNQEIIQWEKKILINPTRGDPDPSTGKDNNALFFGTPGTGKTALTKRICLKINQYPMIEVKGSSLTPTLADHEAGIKPLQKFIYTISDITWNLVDNFGFTRTSDGEVRYILFVDEANQVDNNPFSKSPTQLTFLKECMEGVDKSKQSRNLWIFATNYKKEVDEAVYRPGRLSNPLDFSWTLGDFYEHAKKANIYNQFPQHWKETAVLKKEDNEFVNKFSIKSFHELFLPFWRKFISHPETQKELPEIKKDQATEQRPIQSGIQLGEFFEFFWVLKESSQLKNFTGKWLRQREDKLEEVTNNLIDVVEIRIDETNDLLQQIGTSVNTLANSLQSISSSTIQHEINELSKSITEIRNKLDM